MLRVAPLLAVILAAHIATTASPTFAGQATSSGTYRVPTKRQNVVNWIQANRDRYYKAANAEIIEHRGQDHYLVRSSSPLGSSTYVVRETRTDTDHGTTFLIQLVEKVSGRVTQMQATVDIQDHGAHAQVTMSATINFRHLLASDGRVKSLTNKSVSRTQRLVTASLR